MMPETLVNVNDFNAINGCDVFDLQMYRELGLDLTSLEDSSSEAVVPQLRAAATDLVEAQAMTDKPIKYNEPFGKEFREAEDQVAREMRIAMSGLLGNILAAGKSTVRFENEAVQAYAERHPDVSKTAIKRRMLKQITHLQLVLVRPIDPATDPEWRQDVSPFEGPFTWANDIRWSLGDHASELTQARIGTSTDHCRHNLN